jgi:hypothetical protein
MMPPKTTWPKKLRLKRSPFLLARLATFSLSTSRIHIQRASIKSMFEDLLWQVTGRQKPNVVLFV